MLKTPKAFISSNLLGGQSWLFLILQAVIAILLGAFFLINYKIALIILALALGILLLSCGVQQFMLLFARHRFQFGIAFYGVLLVAAGLFLLLDPLLGVLELMWILGAWMIFHGVELFFASALARGFRTSFRIMAVINGVLSLLCGTVIFLSPLAGFQVINFLFAFYLIFYGIITLILGARLYEITKKH